VGECFFWYQLTRVVPDKFHRAVKWLCVCVLSETTRVSQYQKKRLSTHVGPVDFWFLCTGEDNTDRHIDNLARRHSIRTIQWCPHHHPTMFMQDTLQLQPSQVILAWDRQQVCCLVEKVTNIQICRKEIHTGYLCGKGQHFLLLKHLCFAKCSLHLLFWLL